MQEWLLRGSLPTNDGGGAGLGPARPWRPLRTVVKSRCRACSCPRITLLAVHRSTLCAKASGRRTGRPGWHELLRVLPATVSVTQNRRLQRSYWAAAT